MKEMYNEPTKTNEAMKTMKKFLSMAALALVGAVMTGCSSDDSLTGKAQEPAVKNNVVTLTTTVSLGGDGTRALTDGGVKTFATGDQIAVIYKDTDGNTQKAVSEALTEGGSSSATFTVTLEAPKGGEPVRYIYPAAMAAETVETSTEVTDDATINYAALASQDGTLTTLASKYDLAVFDGSLTAGATLPASSTLKNKLAILAYTIKDAGGTSDLTNTITRLTVSDGPNTYGVTRTAADGPVYIAIRPTSDATISIMAATGTTTYTKSLASKTYVANNIYKAGLKMTEVPGAIPGMFSISSDGKTVFSKGNLQLSAANTWKFADSQWSCFGNSQSDNHRDLFGWGTGNNPNLISENDNDYSTFTDWGSNIYLQSQLGSDWRTLTGGSGGEWEYLFKTRTTATTNMPTGNNSGSARYTKATVAGVSGVILFPDNYAHPAGVTVTVSDAAYNTIDKNYTTFTVDASNWVTMQSAGCVFLPAAGWRKGSTVYGVGSLGYYWSSSPDASDVAYACYVSISLEGLNPANKNNRCRGRSVRLVRPVE